MIALVGNPNCGKSSLFNKLTFNNQMVGNFPGVTTGTSVGKLKNKYIIDLPGIYSLCPETPEEKVTVDYLFNNRLELIVNVIDINKLESSLYLTINLLKLNIPMLVVLSKDDGKSKKIIDIRTLENYLGLNVVKVSVKKNRTILALKEKLISNYSDLFKTTYSNYNVVETSIINDYRNVDNICRLAIKENSSLIKRMNVSSMLDQFLFSKKIITIISIVMFVLIYFFTVYGLGSFISKLLDFKLQYVVNSLTNFINKTSLSLVLKDMLINGLLIGVLSVIKFIPQIIIVMFLISLLMDSGYVSRMSYIFHTIFKKIGLDGKSFAPFLTAFNCSALAILQTRILNRKQRLKTCLLIPFIPCSAKLPIIIFITMTFFNNSFFIFLSFYFLSLIIIAVLGKIFLSSEDSYIFELPPLKIPSLSNALKNTFFQTRDFLVRIVTIILFFSIVNWFLISFDFKFNYPVDFNKSILNSILNTISFLTHPFIGNSNVRVLASSFFGLFAKEQVLSTLNILNIKLNSIQAYSFCCFNLFSIPCINTLVALKKECGFKCMVLYSFIYLLTAYLISIIIFKILLIL